MLARRIAGVAPSMCIAARPAWASRAAAHSTSTRRCSRSATCRRSRLPVAWRYATTRATSTTRGRPARSIAWSPTGDSTVLLIGTGLTMVDVASTLAARVPRRRLLAVSRSGLLPRAHVRGRTRRQPSRSRFDPRPRSPCSLTPCSPQSAAGNPRWHQLVDDLRPLTQALWKRLSIDERADFLATRHRAWCVRRHRMPPEVAAMLAELIGSGRLRFAAARSSSRTRPGGLESRALGSHPTPVALAINCTGPGSTRALSRDPLVVAAPGRRPRTRPPARGRLRHRARRRLPIARRHSERPPLHPRPAAHRRALRNYGDPRDPRPGAAARAADQRLAASTALLAQPA